MGEKRSDYSNSFVCQSTDISVMSQWIPTGSDRYFYSLQDLLFIVCSPSLPLDIRSRFFFLRDVKFSCWGLIPNMHGFCNLKWKKNYGRVMNLKHNKWVICVWITIDAISPSRPDARNFIAIIVLFCWLLLTLMIFFYFFFFNIYMLEFALVSVLFSLFQKDVCQWSEECLIFYPLHEFFFIQSLLSFL